MKRHIRKNKVIRAIKIIEIEATLLITEVIWLLLLFYCRAAGPLVSYGSKESNNRYKQVSIYR